MKISKIGRKIDLPSRSLYFGWQVKEGRKEERHGSKNISGIFTICQLEVLQFPVTITWDIFPVAPPTHPHLSFPSLSPYCPTLSPSFPSLPSYFPTPSLSSPSSLFILPSSASLFHSFPSFLPSSSFISPIPPFPPFLPSLLPSLLPLPFPLIFATFK